MMTKECSKCHRKLDLSLFRLDKYKKDGHSSRCKECLSEKDKVHYRNNTEHKKKIVKDYMIRTGEYYRYKPYDPKYYSSDKSKMKKRARDMRRRLRLKNSTNSYINKDVIENIIKKYNGNCAYCGVNCMTNYHIDHRLPVCRGGSNGFDNLVLSCPHCNLSKGTKTDVEFIGKSVF